MVRKFYKRKFPSPYGVIFILMKLLSITEKEFKLLFPSPYGVIFILIITGEIKGIELDVLVKFPSPYGVIFILIYNKNH